MTGVVADGVTRIHNHRKVPGPGVATFKLEISLPELLWKMSERFLPPVQENVAAKLHPASVHFTKTSPRAFALSSFPRRGKDSSAPAEDQHSYRGHEQR